MFISANVISRYTMIFAGIEHIQEYRGVLWHFDHSLLRAL